MSIDIEGLLSTVDLVAVVESRVDLTRRGANWFGLCPIHGESTPSFTVNQDKGFWHCFGCGAHGDALDFLRQLDGLTLPQAAEALGHLEIKPRQTNGHAQPVREWRSSLPPADAGKPNMVLRGLDGPAGEWEYRNRNGALIGYVVRYKEGQKKTVRCFSWGTDDDKPAHWSCRRFSRPGPLYGLDRLAERPDAQVIVVEGEKTADAAGRLFPRSVCVTWVGGVDGVRHADFSPLKGRRVVCIPDADRQCAKSQLEARRHGVMVDELVPYDKQPGPAAMGWLAQHLHQFECDVRLVDVGIDPDRADGWDLADALADGWTPDQAVAWARDRISRSDPPPKIVEQRERQERQNAMAQAILQASQQQQRQQLEQQRIAAAALSDLALADRFVASYIERWRHIPTSDEWIQWTADGWLTDNMGSCLVAATEVMREAMLSDEARMANASLRRKVCSAGTAASILKLAGVSESIATSQDQWDRDPLLLGVPSGVIDLRNGSLRGAAREDYITRRCAVAPANGEPRLWLSHLRKVLRDDSDAIGFLRRYLGYMLTGQVGEHALLFMFGTGRNGKGTIVETVVRLMGTYGYAAPVNLLMESKNERHPVELAMLRGKRGVSCSEPTQGARWDDGRVKWLTGGDTVTARAMNENFSSFDPTHKLIIMGNHKPSLRSVDEAIKARFCILDFGLTIPLDERDPHFAEKLKEEWPQILAWMIDGALLWQEQGLARPASMSQAIETYLQDEDTIGQWIDDSCERKGSATVAELYRSYTSWCEASGERPWSKKAFSSALYDKPGVGRKPTAAARMVDGLQLRAMPALGGWANH